ncbi:hypothetical protein Gogos_008847 [Gossypium gossypioides]|uniref:Uncharacterized protein n=1 Tax=Gossypium gossypioides TaxID=34282 RepID=A0A7J9CDE5_GOSGO|nr:hypothetical protein [Gossypium gossypioides]
MAGSLIRLDNKHISVNQLQMVEDRILRCHIRNLSDPPSLLIETYLWEGGVVPNMITEGQIEMSWLRNNFVELAEDSTEEKRLRYARTCILQIIGGILMPDKS